MLVVWCAECIREGTEPPVQQVETDVERGVRKLDSLVTQYSRIAAMDAKFVGTVIALSLFVDEWNGRVRSEAWKKGQPAPPPFRARVPLAHDFRAVARGRRSHSALRINDRSGECCLAIPPVVVP